MDDPSRFPVTRRIWLGATVLVLLGVTSTVLLTRDAEPLTATAAAVTPSSAPPTPKTPAELTSAVLKAHAAALLAGDVQGWLAAVDPGQPKLRARYTSMFRSLRGLGVTHLSYHTYGGKPDRNGAVAFDGYLAYCFGAKACPAYNDRASNGPPRIAQALTLKPVGGRYVISAAGKPDEHTRYLQPTPWENGDLFFAHGKRVTVAAVAGQRKHLDRVLRLAEKSAVITDRYAEYVRNPQSRYRIYLADDRAWKSWYGGEDDDWAVGLAVPLNETGTDIVLRMSKMDDRRLLASTIQHEMGHVVTLDGVTVSDPNDRWLTEGIAEYIGWAPDSATRSWRRPSVRAAFRGTKRPVTIVSKPLDSEASDRAQDAFYGLGHFAATCFAERYGEQELFDFVRLTLREGNTYDQASRDAFGRPFAVVDKACVTWIKKKL